MSKRLTTLNIVLGVLFLLQGLLSLTSNEPIKSAWWFMVGVATLFWVYGQRDPDRYRSRGWKVVAGIYLVILVFLTYRMLFAP